MVWMGKMTHFVVRPRNPSFDAGGVPDGGNFLTIVAQTFRLQARGLRDSGKTY